MITESEILNAKILIVDDQESNINLLEQLLTDSAYNAFTSTMNPLEVVSLHQENHYDLILLDLQMPVMDGFEVMAALKQSNADAYLPVLVLTAQPNHKLRALQAGARDFISKPFDLIEVKTRIRNMLEVRLLYKKLENYNQQLEQTVLERTAELRESEARYRSLTELASDWYWEQNEHMHFTKISGPVAEMLGIQIETNLDAGAHEDMSAPHVNLQTGWNEVERDQLRSIIGARKPFLDFILHRSDTDGSQRRFQVSGEPMFDLRCRFTGYRGIGVELTSKQDLQAVDC